jgi:hypothetical protein
MGNYVTIDDLNKEGMPASVTDARADARIAKWEAIVERLTGNVFREVSPGELTFDGNNSSILHFNMPLISVVTLKINGETVALDSTDFRAFIGREKPQDDRHNPKIKLTPIRQSVYRSAPFMFVKGMDQLLEATWGYLEADDSCPIPVKDSITRLVLMDLDGYFEQKAGENRTQLSPVRRERTDGHEMEYMDIDSIRYTWSMIPSDIWEVLSMYRSPLAINSPEPIMYVSDPTIDIYCV